MTCVIRPLTRRDDDIVRSYLEKDPLDNIVLFDGLAIHGLDDDHAEFWGAFRSDRLEGVLFSEFTRFDFENSPRIGSLAGDTPEVLAQLGMTALKTGVKALKGKRAYIEPAAEALSRRVRKSLLTHWHFYETDPAMVPSCHDHPVRVATRDDIPRLLELYEGFEFGSRDPRHHEFEVRKAVDRSTCFFAERDGRAVSGVMIVAESDRAGMTSYTRTLPEFRGTGIYRSVRTACFEYLLRRGKVGLAAVKRSNAVVNEMMGRSSSIRGQWSTLFFSGKPPLSWRLPPSRMRRRT